MNHKECKYWKAPDICKLLTKECGERIYCNLVVCMMPTCDYCPDFTLKNSKTPKSK